ncbi:MAG: CDP-diacylglycerol--glycerol-3-phosphate 3-phosphatidyltransferase [Pirellulaceae bacterium]|nr:CDP-diacylglycerol--glycerol-3-phosphate 3-phosphatidyltransferase [Planctomycetales bacterium]
MAAAQPANPNAPTWTIPNQITAARLVVSLLVFVFLQLGWYFPALVFFVIGAGTDWVDGYLARRWKQITQLGRILDPLADKIIICGTFTFLAAAPGSRILAWMAVVVLARELVVTVIRSFLEQHGRDFSAKWSGKIKMGFQCAAAIGSMLALWLVPEGKTPPESLLWLPPTVTLLAWATVVSTLYSGYVYVNAARRLLI